MQLNRSLSNFGLLSTAICGMIGSGWLFGGMLAAKAAGPAAIFSWIIGGIIIAVIAATFAELATMLPVTGGVVRYIHFSHGTLASFAISWLTWLSCVAVAPTEVTATLHYCSNFFPNLIHSTSYGNNLTYTGTSIAILLLFVLTVLNLTAVKTINKIITKIGSWKIAIPIITALSLIFTKFDSTNFTSSGFAPNGIHGILTAISSIVVFSFLGFVEAISLAGETENPRKAVPIAIIGSVSITVIIYTILQVSFIGATGKDMIASGWSNISFIGQFGPFAGIAGTLGLGFLANLIYADAVISPLGTGFAFTATTARINYAMSVNKYTPASMLKLNENGIPKNAILFNFIIGILILLPFPNWEDLIKFQSAAIILAYATGPISLLALRAQVKNIERPFYLPYSKTVCFLALYFVNLILYWTGWVSISRLMIGLAIGLIFFILYQLYTNKKVSDFNSAWWLGFYCIGLSSLSYIGNFGGHGIIKFGYDFLALAIFSFLVLELSFQGKLTNKQALDLISEEN
jgi:amino acid transporter